MAGYSVGESIKSTVNAVVQEISGFFKNKDGGSGEREQIARLSVSLPADKHSVELFESKVKTYQNAANDKKLPENERHVNGLRAKSYGEGLKILAERQAQASPQK
jgi:hypothetical protein